MPIGTLEVVLVSAKGLEDTDFLSGAARRSEYAVAEPVVIKMSNLQARTGRDHQRYDNNFCLVSGYIPYILVKDEEENSSVEFENKLEVIIVSSPNRHDLVFPKLNIKEALVLCRYEWMQSSLEVFLRVMAEEGSIKEESLTIFNNSDRGERQINSRYCFVVN